MTVLGPLAPDGDGTIDVTIEHDGGTGPPFYTHCDENPASPGTDWVGNDQTETDGVAFFEVANTPSDFGFIDSLSVDYSRQAQGFSDDTCILYVQVFASNESTNYTDEITLADETDTTKITEVGTFTINATGLAASKADWDGARIRFRWDYTQTTGPDNAQIKVFAFELNGAYTKVVTITDVETDEEYDDEDAAVTITGTNFEASQGTGKVEMGDDSDYATANKVEQIIASWADTAIDFTADLNTQNPGSKWLFVTNNSSIKNDPGFAVTVHRIQAFQMAASANIAASGENTTAQLAAPGGKTTADFDTGRIQDDENPADSVNITPDDYTEMEWSIKAITSSREVSYSFRVTDAGALLQNYTVTPTLTISISGAITVMNQLQGANVGADLFNGTII